MINPYGVYEAKPTMVLGIGMDIIEIERIVEVFRRNPRFGSRVFTPGELEYCHRHSNSSPHLAARFAAKEAVAKALGRSFSWQDVEIESDGRSQPAVRLHGRAREFAAGRRIMLSMSHSRNYAAAMALVLEEQR